MSDSLVLSGGIVVYVINKKSSTFYYSENSTWLLDDWYNNIEDGSYFNFLAQFKLDIFLYSNEELKNNLPQLLINFDEKTVINNYYDQALEDRIPEFWSGIWIEGTDDFLNLIPVEDRYWEFKKNRES